jgi:hypothetical protein
MKPHYYIGLDLGQARDYTALVAMLARSQPGADACS